jgi:hypothetical protein
MARMHFNFYDTLQMHCPENSKQMFPEMKLRALVPNFYIHLPISDLYTIIFPRLVRKRNKAYRRADGGNIL